MGECGNEFWAAGESQLGIERTLIDTCELPSGHAGRHKRGNASWGEVYPVERTAPTQQEQQAINRALWSEIGLAIGRIEASIPKLFEFVEKEAAGRYDRLLSLISVLHDSAEKARQGRSDAARNVFQRLDERLGAIEKRLTALHGPECGDTTGSIRGIDTHLLALAKGLHELHKSRMVKPKRKRERKGKRLARRTGK